MSMGLLSAALVMAASIQATAQEYTFTTFAGPPELGPGDADGPGNLELLVLETVRPGDAATFGLREDQA